MNEQKNSKSTDSSSESSKPINIYAEIFEYVESFVFGCCVLMFILTFVLRICQVDGPSMNQTLTHGDRVIISNAFYEPQQYDIVVFHQTDDDNRGYNERLVKRVIATGGHYVKIDFNNDAVYVSDDNIFDDSDLIDESEYKYLDIGRWNRSGVLETYVPEGKLFVMGDNRNNSADSRSAGIGLVDSRRVLGKVVVRFWPLSSFKLF